MVNPFTIQLSEKTKNRWRTTANNCGYKALSRFISDCVETIIRNPDLLIPTESNFTDEIKKSVQASLETANKLSDTLYDFRNRLHKIEKSVEWLMRKSGASSREIRRVLEKDDSGEAVFE